MEMYTMFKKFSFYLFQFILLFQGTICSNQVPNREMIILLETTNAENLDITLDDQPDYQFEKILHPTGIGAITVTLLIALYQKAAPIIANKSLIKNLIDHQNLFSDFVNLDRNSLYSKYGHYNRFKGRLVLDNFRANFQYLNKSVIEVNKMLGQLITNDNKADIDKILHKIVLDPRFNIKNSPSNLQRLNHDTSAIKALVLEMIIYTLCSWVDFKKDWQIKQVNEDIFILIPNDYLKNLNLINYPQKTSAQTPSVLVKQFTDLELELGLKIDHMKTVDRSLFELPALANKTEIPFKTSLEQIFITYDDIKQGSQFLFPIPTKETKHIWSLYMAGHGIPNCPQIGVLPQLYELRNLSKKKLGLPKFKACLAYEKNKQNGSSIDANHLHLCKHHESCKRHIDKIKRLNAEIKRIEPITLSPDRAMHGIIASLSIDEFRDVLKFFNNCIETTFLYYTSCFAGGTHLIKPFTETDSLENNKSLILKFPVISGTPAENMSLQEFPFINLPPYIKTNESLMLRPSDIHPQDIDLKNKKLKLHTTLQFNSFFGALRKGLHNNVENIILVPYSLHPHIDKFGKIRNQLIPNIPLIRLANSDHFQPIPNDNSSEVLDSTNSSKPMTITKDATLIYSDYISGKITLNKLGSFEDSPQLFSMIPGFALHTFEEIGSATLNLKEIVNSFLIFPELGSSKIFWIKKLECKSSGLQNSKTEVLKDVIILRNVFNSDTLARCSNGQPIRLENCAYLSTSANTEAKLTWNGPFIETDNYKINNCNQSNHKEECLNCFPNAISCLSPVLQSI